MTKNESTVTVNIDEAVEYLDKASSELEDLISFLIHKGGLNRDPVEIDTADFIKKLKSIRIKVDEAWSDLPENGTDEINDWKDIVISTLPKGASVAMANDVEAALDQFKSVY